MHFSKEAGSLSTTSEVPRHLGDAHLRGVTGERRHCTFYWKPVARHFQCPVFVATCMSENRINNL